MKEGRYKLRTNKECSGGGGGEGRGEWCQWRFVCSSLSFSSSWTLSSWLGGGGVQPLLLCRGRLLFFGLAGKESSVREPRGEEVLLVEVEEEDVLAGGLVTGSWQSSCSSLSSLELWELPLV